MVRYLIRRLLLAAPVVVGILLITFLIKAAVPTDAVTAMYQGQMSEKDAAQAIAALKAKFHLDLRWHQQLLIYGRDLLHGELGESIRLRRPVVDEIGYRYVNTILLTGAALLIALVVCVTTGVVAAARRNTWLDITATTVGLFGISMPAFFFGLLLILVISVWLRLLPVVPHGPIAILLPALSLGLIEAAPVSRVTRTSMIDVLRRDYIRAARAWRRGGGAYIAARTAECPFGRSHRGRAANRQSARRSVHHRDHIQLARYWGTRSQRNKMA
jgi:ABC-type dipeptide/oligopeptide/nickel transport system permease component